MSEAQAHPEFGPLLQQIPIVDGSGFVNIYAHGVAIDRKPEPPAPEPMRFQTEKQKAKVEAEMAAGAEAVRKHKERAEWAKQFNANRQKLASELLSEEKEAAAAGSNRPFRPEPGGSTH